MFGIPIWVGWLIGAVVLAGGSFYEGIQVEADHRDAHDLKLQQIVFQQYTTDVAKFNAISTSFENQLAGIHLVHDIVTKQVDNIVTRTLYSNVCLDADGLSAANTALIGKTPIASGSDGKLSVTVPIARRNGSVSP